MTERIRNEYPPEWPAIASAVKNAAGWECIRCGHPNDQRTWSVRTDEGDRCLPTDAKAIREPVTGNAHARGDGVNPKARVPSGWDTGPGNHKARRGRYPRSKQNESFSGAVNELVSDRNKRSVWTIASEPFPDAHFATFPIKLVEPCILAGCPEGGVVLDPFCGSGTTGVVALRADRRFVGIELNEQYVEMARRRIGEDAPLLNREDPTLLELAA